MNSTAYQRERDLGATVDPEDPIRLIGPCDLISLDPPCKTTGEAETLRFGQLILELLNLLQHSRMRNGDGRVIGKRAKPGKGALIAGAAIEHAKHAEDFVTEHERLAGEAADTFVANPVRACNPTVIVLNILDENSRARRANAADLP